MTSYSCSDQAYTFDVYPSLFGISDTLGTPPPAQTQPAQCLPGILYRRPDSDCATKNQILLPFILSNAVSISVNILAGHRKIRRRLRFWKKDGANSENYRFKPLAGLSRVGVVILQAVVSAALIRAGGSPLNFGLLVAWWLLRPRVMWSLPFLFFLWTRDYLAAATEGLFADLLLNLTTVPILTLYIKAWSEGEDICGPNPETVYQDGNTDEYHLSKPIGLFGSEATPSARALSRLICIFLALSAISFFALIAFCLNPRLKRNWAFGAGLFSLAIFAVSWVFWICKYIELCNHSLAYYSKKDRH